MSLIEIWDEYSQLVLATGLFLIGLFFSQFRRITPVVWFSRVSMIASGLTILDPVLKIFGYKDPISKFIFVHLSKDLTNILLVIGLLIGLYILFLCCKYKK